MTGRIGLLGWPVEHSVSAAMHNAAFAALGLDWRYDLLPVRPGELAERVSDLLAAGYRGFNVTVPHKRAALRLPQIAESDGAARATGAANTLIAGPGGALRAANTDWLGFADDLRAHGVAVEGRRCLVLGTGGAARAVEYALAQMGAANVTFVSRRPDGRAGVIGYDSLPHPPTPSPPAGRGREAAPPLPATGGRDRDEGAPQSGSGGEGLIINCTPVGMWPRVDASPWPDGTPFPAGAILYDLVYNPPVTRLMQQARDGGARAIGGLGMLVRQGAQAFRLWAGVDAPLEVMQRAAEQALRELARGEG